MRRNRVRFREEMVKRLVVDGIRPQPLRLSPDSSGDAIVYAFTSSSDVGIAQPQPHDKIFIIRFEIHADSEKRELELMDMLEEKVYMFRSRAVPLGEADEYEIIGDNVLFYKSMVFSIPEQP